MAEEGGGTRPGCYCFVVTRSDNGIRRVALVRSQALATGWRPLVSRT